MKAVNSVKNESILPKNVDRSELNDGVLQVMLNKASWNVIRLGK